MVTTDFGLVSSLFLAAILIFGLILGPTWSKKGTFGAKSGAFGAPGRQEEARYHESNLGTAAGGSWDKIWLPGALRVPPRPPKGAFWDKTSSFGVPGDQEEVQYQAKVCGIQLFQPRQTNQGPLGQNLAPGDPLSPSLTPKRGI